MVLLFGTSPLKSWSPVFVPVEVPEPDGAQTSEAVSVTSALRALPFTVVVFGTSPLKSWSPVFVPVEVPEPDGAQTQAASKVTSPVCPLTEVTQFPQSFVRSLFSR